MKKDETHMSLGNTAKADSDRPPSTPSDGGVVNVIPFGIAVEVCQCGHGKSRHMMMPLSGCPGAESLTCCDCYADNPDVFCTFYRPIKGRIGGRITGPEACGGELDEKEGLRRQPQPYVEDLKERISFSVLDQYTSGN